MAKKPISQKRAERRQQENAALQKVLNVFLLVSLTRVVMLMLPSPLKLSPKVLWLFLLRITVLN